MDDPELTRILASARAGDEQAAAELYRACNPLLLRYLRHHAPAEAEDIAADTWLAATRAGESLPETGDAFRAWLFTVARRRVADLYRTRSRRPRLVELGPDAEQQEPVGPDDAVLSELGAQQAIAHMARLLPQDQLDVVLLRVLGGLSVDEVATTLGRRPGTVRVLQHRAMRRLAQRWGSAVTP